MPDKPWPEWLPFSPEAAYEKGCEELTALADEADRPEHRQFGITPTEIRRLMERNE